jgi:hypothetical protein
MIFHKVVSFTIRNGIFRRGIVKIIEKLLNLIHFMFFKNTDLNRQCSRFKKLYRATLKGLI